MSLLMGIDVGTSSTKVELVAEDGRSWSAASPSYRIDMPRRGWAEQDPETWWRAVHDAVGRVWSQARPPAPAAVTIGFTGQMHSTVLLDASGIPLRPSVLWCDTRADRESQEIAEAMPDVADVTGNVPLPAFTSAHLLWVRRHERQVYDRVSTVLQPKDYVRFRATGVPATDPTDASGTGLLDVRTRSWSGEVLDRLGLDRAILPEVRPSIDLLDDVRGLLPDGVGGRVAVGLGDQFAEALSAGLVDTGPLVVVLGTSGVLLRVQRRQSPGVFCHAPDDRWLRLESLHAGGLSLTWFRDAFRPGRSIDEVMAEAADVAPGAGGLVFLPFLAGERGGEDELGGSFVGARPMHTRGHFARAVLEGVALELRRIAETRMAVTSPPSVVLKGGGARSRLWAQVFADVFRAPVGVSARTAASGAVDLAGVAAGWWSYEDLDGRPVPGVIDPDPARAAVYDDTYRRYRGIVEALLG